MSFSLEDFIARCEKGFGKCYDFELTEEEFEQLEENLHETSRTRVTDKYPEATSYRDDRSRKSLHVTDYRGMEREDAESDVVVAHVENFNPEVHPVLHTLVDFPLWFYRNRVKERNRL